LNPIKNLVSEIGKIAGYLEDLEEPWTYRVVFSLDKIAQELEEISNRDIEKLSSINKTVLGQYLGRILFLNENAKTLKSLIEIQRSKKASVIYKKLKNHFGKLKKEDSIEFIQNILKLK